jgi:hypothetical protein
MEADFIQEFEKDGRLAIPQIPIDVVNGKDPPEHVLQRAPVFAEDLPGLPVGDRDGIRNAKDPRRISLEKR